MTQDFMLDIVEFHERFRLPPMSPGDFFREGVFDFRLRFLLEELAEGAVAYLAGDHATYLDSLVDLDYVLLGTGYLVGAAGEIMPKEPAGGRPAPRLPSIMEIMYTQGQLAMLVHLLGRKLETCSAFMTWPEKPPVELRTIHDIIVRQGQIASGYRYAEAWNRVHAANMAKVRTARAADSKRGSGYDVVKPEGWTAPTLADLVV